MEDQAEKFKLHKKHNGLLLVASSRGYLADVEGLLELGAALDCKDKQGRAPLHFAAANGRTAVVRFLWSKGAEVDAETPEGRTPLHLAALAGHAEAAALLLQKGGWAEAYDCQDDTPLHLAARFGHTAVMEVLFEHGAKAGAENKQGLTPMGCALVGNHVAPAKLLRGWGASLTDKPHGYSLLHLAAGVGSLASVTFLLECGADPNERDNREGVTPLHSAALGACVRCVKALLEAGADPGLEDSEGKLAADLVAPQDAAQLAELLAAKPSGMAKAGAKKAGWQPSPSKSAQQQFIDLPQSEQLRKVERWALLEPADLAASLGQYPPHAAAETTARMVQLSATRCLLNIHKAQAALHADEEFQADAQQSHVREAIDAIRADTSKYERYAANPQILSVLQKMRRMHGVAQANGQRTVEIEGMLAKPGWEQRDSERRLAIEAACSAHLAAAAAAAATVEGASAEEAAKAAYEAAFQKAKEAASGSASAAAAAEAKKAAEAETATKGAVATKLAAAGTSATSMLRQRMAGGGGGGGGAGGGAGASTAVGDAAGREIEEREKKADEDDDLPEYMKGGFSWKKVGQEFMRQSAMSLIFLVIFLIGSWIVRGRPPWVL
ncbi:hypothetical protein D9Q98_008964 [Chlorella vulgaris]|uniref:Uncharacterized protein n=1 Tax=Chlorella vulgaris TaxID=3077 RepID=A0A9D4TH02_CHLVU|nr:hypothetical protein D9Q98_008964 [Chlorella vulgaris]